MSTDPWRHVVRRAISARDRRPERAHRPHLVICGSDPLVYTIAEELVGSAQRLRVTAVVPPTMRADVPDPAELDGVRVVRAERLDERLFRSVGLADARALALVHSDDVLNVHAALCAREVNPHLRLVLRLFDGELGREMPRMFPDCEVLSDSAMAAPEFIAAALGQLTPTSFRYAGRTLRVARRADVRPRDIVCVLTAGGAEGDSEVLPVDAPDGPDDQVLAEAVGLPLGPPPRAVRPWRRHRPLLAVARALRAALSRKLGIAVAVTLAVLIVSGAVLAQADHVDGFWRSLYVTLLTAVGSSDVDVQRNPVAQAAQLLLTISGLALLPLVTAAVVEGIVNARLALADGRVRNPRQDHVVVVGLGSVGTRILRQLTDLGVQVVAIDVRPDALGVRVARQHGIPVIIGDAADMDVLRAASLTTSQALVVVSTDDVANLRTALKARTLRRDQRVVLRLFNGDFAKRVQRTFDLGISRSVSYLAAPAFAAAMLDREVRTISVERHVLVVAQLVVPEGSPVVGTAFGRLGHVPGLRVIGLRPRGAAKMSWSPQPEHRLAPGDVLSVVSRRRALRVFAERLEPLPPPEPEATDPPRVVPSGPRPRGPRPGSSARRPEPR
jgi:Trk K+ transport system NAD-binding subunit